MLKSVILIFLCVCEYLVASMPVPNLESSGKNPGDFKLVLIRKKRSSSFCSYSLPWNRVDCGWPGITRSECTSKDCCFDSFHLNYYNCFKKTEEETTISDSESRISAFPSSSLNVFTAGAGSKTEGTHFADASVGTWETSNGKGQLIYGNVDANSNSGISASVGFINHRAGVGGTSGSSTFGVSHKVLVAQADIHNGVMGRATLYDGTLHAGPVDVNLGVGFDTGVKFDDGVEAKYLGIGGKISSRGVEICFIVCVGIFG